MLCSALNGRQYTTLSFFPYFISDSLALQWREQHLARSPDCKSVAEEVIPLVLEKYS